MLNRDLSPRAWWGALLALTLLVLVALSLVACATPGPRPPIVVVQPPSPVCGAGQTTGCYHNPGTGWVYACPILDWQGGVTGVANVPTAADCKPTKLERPTSCPKKLAVGARVYVQAKYYGNGVDGSPRVIGDPEFCRLIHGVAVNDCHLEGWSDRLGCELELLGGCPEWEFRENASMPWRLAKMTSSDAVTVDHHGNTAYRDDPQTAPFEGQPAVCGQQRDALGNPKGGFFVIAHGAGEVRACAPSHDPATCGDPKIVIDPSTR